MRCAFETSCKPLAGKYVNLFQIVDIKVEVLQYTIFFSMSTWLLDNCSNEVILSSLRSIINRVLHVDNIDFLELFFVLFSRLKCVTSESSNFIHKLNDDWLSHWPTYFFSQGIKLSEKKKLIFPFAFFARSITVKVRLKVGGGSEKKANFTHFDWYFCCHRRRDSHTDRRTNNSYCACFRNKEKKKPKR